MRDILERILEYVHGAMVVAALMSLFSLFIEMAGFPYASILLCSLSLLFPYLVSGIAESRVKSVFPFLCICVVSGAVPWVAAPHVAIRVFYVIFTIAIIALRMAERVKERKGPLSAPHPGVLLLFIVCYILGVALKNEPMSTLNYYFAFAYVILIAIYENMNRLDGYLELNKDVANVPRRQIFRTNNLLLLFFIAVATLIMVFLPRAGLDEVVRSIGKGLWWLFRKLISLIHFKDNAPAETVEEVVEEVVQDSGGMMMPDAKETPAWLAAASKTITLGIFLTFLFFFLVSLGTAVYAFIKKFYRSYQENGDEEEFLKPQDDEKSAAPGENTGKRPLWLDFSPDAQVRKTYRKTILKKKKVVASNAFTPEQLEDYAELTEADNREVLHTLYEKARYSKRGVEKDDLKALKH